MNILVTGAAGFIGFHLSQALCARGDHVVGVDNLNDYYSVALKQARLDQLNQLNQFEFIKLDIADRAALAQLSEQYQFDVIVNLAAQAGVRYSIDNPQSYIDSNLVGFGNILELARQQNVNHLVYASSSSVYGSNTRYPYAEDHSVNHPISLYAASKKANELMAHTYAHLYQIPCTGLRFFTVYGPWGRPDMAYFKFAERIMAGQPIDVYNEGNMWRDFTYVDDIVAGMLRAIDTPATPDQTWDSKQPNPASSQAPFRVYNIGYGSPVRLLDFIELLEKALGKKAIKQFKPIQPGDVFETFADTTRLQQDLHYQPAVSFADGIACFVDWFTTDYAKLIQTPVTMR